MPQLPQDALPNLAEVEMTVAAMTEPCNSTWCMARVAALLSPYYDKNTAQAVREIEAEDWLEALAPYPQWAIERAVRWWKSADNADRRKKPLEGDISARCKVEMRGIGSLPEIMNRKATGRWIETEPPREKTTPEQRKSMANEVLAKAGFTPKRMGGAA